MDSALNNALIIAASVVAAIAFLFVVTRTSTAPARKESNDFTGAVVAVIGTTYAVILAFTLSGVWTMFQEAQKNEEQEANALVNIYRIAGLLDSDNAAQIRTLCLRYGQHVVQQEIHTLETGALTPEGSAMVDEFWRLAGQARVHGERDDINVYQLTEELRLLTQYRRIRALNGREELPAILWAVLIAGGVITVAASCFFGVPSFRFHLLQVIVLSLLIALVLVAIADIDRPYQGVVKVQPEGFRYALQTLGNDGSP